MKAIPKSMVCLFIFFNLCFLQCAEPPASPKSSAKTLTNLILYGIIGASATLDAATSTYTIIIPVGTDITALKLSFTLPTGATVKPASGSVQNFTNPITYTVTAEDGSTQTFTIKVATTVVPKSSEKQIIAFSFSALIPIVSATIDQTSHKILATVPSDANMTALVPTISVSAKATVAPVTGVAQNFTNPVSYTVTAEDGSKQTYDVTITRISTSTLINLVNSNAVAQAIMLPDGSTDSNGALPIPSTNSQSPIVVTKGGAEINTINGVPQKIDIQYSNLTGSIAGIHLQVEGASNYATIPFKSIYNFNSGELSIPVVMSPQFDSGSFNLIYSIFDDSGRESNRQKIKITINFLTPPLIGKGFVTRSDMYEKIFRGDALCNREDVVSIIGSKLGNEVALDFGKTNNQKDQVGLIYMYPYTSSLGDFPYDNPYPFQDVRFIVNRYITIISEGPNRGEYTTDGYFVAKFIDDPNDGTWAVHYPLEGVVFKSPQMVSFTFRMLPSVQEFYYNFSRTGDLTKSFVVQGYMYCK